MEATLESENKELKQRLALYEKIMDNILQGIRVCDNKENIVWFNDVVQINEGISRESSIGKTASHARQNLEISAEPTNFSWETGEQIKEEIVTYADKETGKTFTAFRCSQPFYAEDELKYVFSVSYYNNYAGKQLNKIDAYEKRYADNNVSIVNHHCNDLDHIAGKSAVIRDLIKRAKNIAATDTPVLICGPNGAGKKIFAQGIHSASQQRNGKFVAINCTAMPKKILDTILFGTAADTNTNTPDKAGLLEEANEGTLFLYGIEWMAFPLQEKLLKLFREKQACRLGSSQPYAVNCRLLSATDQDPRQLVADGLLRSDLYFQLAVLTLDLPPLCTRENDVIDLTEYFIEKYNEEYQLAVKKATQKVYQLFIKYDWPGNVQELKNVIAYAMNAATVNQTNISYHDLPSYLKEYNETSIRTSRIHLLKNDKSLHDILDITEKELVCSVLKETGWNISRSAKILNIHREALYYRIAKFNITKP